MHMRQAGSGRMPELESKQALKPQMLHHCQAPGVPIECTCKSRILSMLGTAD